MTDKETKLARRRACAAEKRKTDSRIRVGDRVRILTPAVFIRCGYPMGRREAIAKIIDNHEEDLREFLKKLGIHWTPEDGAHEQLLHRLAYAYQRAHSFGGYKRRIYTEDRPYLAGAECIVKARRTVTTGTYFAPSGGGGSWFGEYDYDPGGLDDAQQHVLFEVIQVEKTLIRSEGDWIEAKNLEKIVVQPAANKSELIPF